MNMDIQYQKNKLILPEVACKCGINHGQPDMDIYIGQGIIDQVVEYLQTHDLGKTVTIVTDNIVYDIAAKKVVDMLEAADFHVDLCLIRREGTLIPNEVALGEILLTVTNETDFLLAVGSGSITDITRYVAHRTEKPFAVVGTAPSMDGYTSVVAPLTYGQLKMNKPADYPKVLICDLDILAKAPHKMILSGFGDVIGKYISKADWTLGSIVNNEVICPFCIKLVSSAVNLCMANIDGIKQHTIDGVRALIEGLVLSGITILIAGHTRPAASNEHNMAHYWEMMKLLKGETPPGHGYSVGVATIYVLKFFELYFETDITQVDFIHAQNQNPTELQRNQTIIKKYGNIIGPGIIADNGDDFLTEKEHQRRFSALVKNHQLIKERLQFLPNSAEMIKIYRNLGYPTRAADIGVDNHLLLNSLLHAKEYRSRYSIFKSAHELGLLPKLVQKTMLALA